MAKDIWTASGIGTWTNGADWSSVSPPGGTDDAFIGSGSGGIVGVGVNAIVSSIGVSTNYAIEINSNATLEATLGTTIAIELRFMEPALVEKAAVGDLRSKAQAGEVGVSDF